jgi:hypothetical protein
MFEDLLKGVLEEFVERQGMLVGAEFDPNMSSIIETQRRNDKKNPAELYSLRVYWRGYYENVIRVSDPVMARKRESSRKSIAAKRARIRSERMVPCGCGGTMKPAPGRGVLMRCGECNAKVMKAKVANG